MFPHCRDYNGRLEMSVRRITCVWKVINRYGLFF